MDTRRNPKISIITPTLNQAKFIEDTIDAITRQDYENVEHIIIDGGSTDGTLNILQKYPHLKWISEKDTGQSNAINKGFRMASGDIVAWINSDDYYEEGILSVIAEHFNRNPETRFLYGDITFIDENKNILDKICGPTMTVEGLLRNPDIVRQPTCFWRREIFDTVGYLNESLHLVMDYDFFLRIGKHYPFKYLNKNVSYFRYYPTNKTNSMLQKQVIEIISVLMKNKLPIHVSTVAFLMKRYFRSGLKTILQR